MFDRLWEVIVACFDALMPFTVLMPYQRGVLLRLGLFVRELGPGFHWCYPLHIDSIIHEGVVPRTERITGLSTTTVDGKAVGFDAVVTYQISDIKKAVLQVEDLKDAIADSCAGQIGTTLSSETWEDIWHGKVIERLTTDCRKRGWRWGVEIMSVQLAGIALVRNLRITIGSAPAHNGSTFNITH
jgi:regulator of protease activity HflC (stomatin/prohibitin superfamily)